MTRSKLPIAIAVVLGVALVAVFGIFAVQSGRADDQSPILQYPQFAPTPTIPVKPDNASPASATRSFDDSFKSNSIDQYELVDLSGGPADYAPKWDVKDGALFQNGSGALNDPSQSETLAVIRSSNGSDYVVSAKVYDEGNATFGLVARRTGNSFYRFSMIANQYEATPKIRLEKVIDGVVTRLATLDAPGYQPRQWYTLTLSVKGTDIQASVDSKQVLAATDATLNAGQAGVYTRAIGDIRFDDITLTEQ